MSEFTNIQKNCRNRDTTAMSRISICLEYGCVCREDFCPEWPTPITKTNHKDSIQNREHKGEN